MPRSGAVVVGLSMLSHARSKSTGIELSRVGTYTVGAVRLGQTVDPSIAALVPEVDVRAGLRVPVGRHFGACAWATGFRWLGPQDLLLEPENITSAGHRVGGAVGAHFNGHSRVQLGPYLSGQWVAVRTTHDRGAFASPRDSTIRYGYRLWEVGVGVVIDGVLAIRLVRVLPVGLPVDTFATFAPLGQDDRDVSLGIDFSFVIPRKARE